MTQLQFNNALLGLRDRLHHYALSLTSDADKADDLLQETFLKALLYRKKFTQNYDFKAWIYTIMKNIFINNYRRNTRIKKVFDNSSNEFYLKTSDLNQYYAPDIIGAKEISKCINDLKDEYRIPFSMFVEGFKYHEIAEELDIPNGTVKSRIFFTRKILKNALPEYNI